MPTRIETSRPKGRGFDTSFEAQAGLIHRFSRTVYSRVMATGVSLTYEDIFQEACLTYAESLRTYKSEYGITFSAYMGRSVLNNLNRYADKRIDERVKHGVRSFTELADNDEGDDFDVESYLPDSAVGIEQIAIRSVEISERIGKLSPRARRVVRELLSPSPGVRAKHREHIRQQILNRGPGGRAPNTNMSVRMIGRYLGYSREQIIEVAQEYKFVLGVSIHV